MVSMATNKVKNGTTAPAQFAVDAQHPRAIDVAKLIDDGLNLRKNLELPDQQKKTEELAASIEDQGQLQPIVVADPSAKWTNGEYIVVGGFRRRLALMLINGKLKEKGKESLQARIEVKYFETRDEAMAANMATDGPIESIRNFDYADRMMYLHKKFHTPLKALAKMAGKDPATVTKLVGAYDGLCKEVKEEWAKCPDANTEIPLARLYKWSKLTPAEQKKALAIFLNGDQEPASEGGEGEGEGEGEGDDKRIDGKRPGKRLIMAEVEKIQEKLASDPSKEEQIRLEAVSKALRWSLGDIKRLW